MEDSSDQSHWVSPSLLSSDPLAAFSSDPGLLASGEEGEAFFSGTDTDYAGLSSFFPNPSNSRAPSSYRHSSGEHLKVIFPPLNPNCIFSFLFFVWVCLKSGRCTPPQVSLVISNSWMGPPATPWAHLTALQLPPGAAVPSPKRRCTLTPRPPSTAMGSPPPSPPPEMATRPPGERGGRAPVFRRP